MKLAIHLEKNSHAEIIVDEKTTAAENNFSNLMIHTLLDENSSLDCLTLHQENSASFYFVQHDIFQKAHSHFREITQSIKARWLRRNINIHLQEAHANCQLLGTYHGKDKSHIDHHLNVFHEHSHCESDQFYKGVVDDQSRVVFNGKIYVAKDAQKSISHQKNDTILLSAHAEIDTKPELEIYANDVICSHGATVGALDEAALFFLCTRGISETQARDMLLSAFMREVFQASSLNETNFSSNLFAYV